MTGLYAEHVKEHGKEFLYMRHRKTILAAPSTELESDFGDVGQIGIISAKLKTYTIM